MFCIGFCYWTSSWTAVFYARAALGTCFLSSLYSRFPWRQHSSNCHHFRFQAGRVGAKVVTSAQKRAVIGWEFGQKTSVSPSKVHLNYHFKILHIFKGIVKMCHGWTQSYRWFCEWWRKTVQRERHTLKNSPWFGSWWLKNWTFQKKKQTNN